MNEESNLITKKNNQNEKSDCYGDVDLTKDTTVSKCVICGEDNIPEEHLKKIKIKGEYKRICDECAEIIHGLV